MQDIKLPPSIVSSTDVNKIARDLGELEQYMITINSREKGKSMSLPKVSSHITDLAEANKLNVLKPEDRKLLVDIVGTLKKSPLIHISFATMPQPSFIAKIIEWMRREIHPTLLVQVGLQPSIAAGCVVRTNNKYFDFSLSAHLDKNRPALVERIKTL